MIAWTESITEAELEAAARAALFKAFPWLAQKSVRLQTTFVVRLGSIEHTVRGHESVARGRADILVHVNDKPLAIIELKKPAISLRPDDCAQAFSYAQFTVPPTPIVVLTNGDDTQVFRTYDRALVGSDVDELALEQALKNVATAAKGDLREAISTLLRGPCDWVDIVRQLSRAALAEQTATDVADLRFPFSPLRLPRIASAEVISLISEGQRAVAVTGAPLAGKSNVLRELVDLGDESDSIAVLYLEGEAGGHGLFQRIANDFRGCLGWNASVDDVRAWLHARSNALTEPILVLAIDDADAIAMRADVEELLAASHGPRLAMVLALSETGLVEYTENKAGTKMRPLARRGKTVRVSDLTTVEMANVLTYLAREHHLEFMRGARYSAQLRIPRILRALLADVSRQVEYRPGVTALLPPLVRTEIFDFLRELYRSPEVRAASRLFMRAVIDDARAGTSSVEVSLRRTTSYAISRERAAARIAGEYLTLLVDVEFIRRAVLGDGQPVYNCRLPELFAMEMAALFANEINEALDPGVAAVALSATSAKLYFGDVAAAQAILLHTRERKSASYGLINGLLSDAPFTASPAHGTKFALEVREGGLIDVYFTSTEVVIRSGDSEKRLPITKDMQLLSNIESWLILSHLVRYPLFGETHSGEKHRIDTDILLTLGQCPFPLRRADNTSIDGIDMHEHGDESIVCANVGIIEPITLAILDFLDRENLSVRNLWLQRVRATESLPLLSRVSTALEALESFSKKRVAWSKRERHEIRKDVRRHLGDSNKK